MELENREWLLIKTFPIEWTLENEEVEEDGTVYYHLLENKEGHRKLLITHTFEIGVGDEPYRSQIYNEKIIRWVYGRPDPDIPKYKDVALEDTANFLRGKVE